MEGVSEDLGGGVSDTSRGENYLEAKELIQQEKEADCEGGDRKLAPGSKT